MTVTPFSIIKKLLILFLILVALRYAKDFLMPLFIGGVLATLFLPLSRWLEQNKIPKAIAIILCVSMLLILIGGVVLLIGWQVSSLTENFSALKQKAIQAANLVQEYVFDHSGITAAKQTEILNNENLSINDILQFAGDSIIDVMKNFILVIAYIFLFLYYRGHLKSFILKLTSPPKREEVEKTIGSVALVSQQYLIGLTKIIFLLWIMYGIGFTILGIKNALFFAIICGLLEIIPFIGNITGTMLTVVLAAVQGSSIPLLIGVVVTYCIVQFIQGWVLEPIILGPQVKINPFTTVVVLVLGGLIWGISGIFIAIPLTAMFKIICDHVDALKPYGFLIGPVQTQKVRSSKWFNKRAHH